MKLLPNKIDSMKIVIIATIFKPLIFLRLILLLSLLLLFPTLICGQFQAAEGYGLVGEKICITISFPDSIITGHTNAGAIVYISGDFHLSNPTVFYPENFTTSAGYSMIDSSITRLSDSTYTFIISFRIDENIIDTVVFNFCGEALAGSDSVCILTFSGLALNNEPAQDFDATVRISTIAGTIPYIQFPRITNIYPNPAEAGESFIVQYYSYKKADIKFYLINVVRQEELIANFKSVEQGPSEFTYMTGQGFAAGAYWIIMITEMGFDFKGVIIIK